MPHPSRQFWLRPIALLLLVAALGLPINHLAAYGLVVIGALVIFTTQVSASPARWLVAIAAVLLAAGAHLLIDPPRVEEGHNIFLADGDRAPLAAALPPDVHGFMVGELARVYPPERRCDPGRTGCWRGQGFPDRAYAFAADGLWDRPEMSRKVGGIDFGNPVDLRLAATNDARYNWYPAASDILRLKRDGRAWKGYDRWQLLMSWYVAYRFPQAFVGGELCWTGNVLWEDAAGRFPVWRHATPACRTLEPADAGRRIFGVAIEPGSLSMRLDPPAAVRMRQLLDAGLRVVVVLAILVLLAGWPPRRALWPVLLIGLVAVAATIDDASFLGGFRPHDGGDDGLKYEGFAAEIVQHLLAGNVGQALMGAEPVFYYGGPGFRYLRAIERFLVGDTNLGYLSLLLLLPIVVFALFRRFLGLRWALVLALAFVATPLGVVFGSSFFQYLTFAARGYADPAAYFFFLSGLVVLAGSAPTPDGRFWPAFGGALLLALGVFLRPNIAPMTGILLAGIGLMGLWHGQWRRVAGLCLGFSLVLFMPLHNWLYGGELVLFSTNANHPDIFLMPPSAYLGALHEVMRLDFGGPFLGRMLWHWAGWFGGLAESWLLIPLHVAAVAVVAYVALRGRGHEPLLRVIAAAALAQQGVGLVYINTPRYHLLTWLVAFLVVAAWAQREAFPWLARRAPRLFENGPVKAVEAKLASLQQRLGLA